jgi:hypothetical protein
MEYETSDDNERTLSRDVMLGVKYVKNHPDVSGQPFSTSPADMVEDEGINAEVTLGVKSKIKGTDTHVGLALNSPSSSQSTIAIFAATSTILIAVSFVALFLRRRMNSKKTIKSEIVARYVEKFDIKNVHIMRAPTGGFNATYEWDLEKKCLIQSTTISHTTFRDAFGDEDITDKENSARSSMRSVRSVLSEDSLLWNAISSVDFTKGISSVEFTNDSDGNDDDYANDFGFLLGSGDDSTIDSTDCI